MYVLLLYHYHVLFMYMYINDPYTYSSSVTQLTGSTVYYEIMLFCSKSLTDFMEHTQISIHSTTKKFQELTL